MKAYKYWVYRQFYGRYYQPINIIFKYILFVKINKCNCGSILAFSILMANKFINIMFYLSFYILILFSFFYLLNVFYLFSMFWSFYLLNVSTFWSFYLLSFYLINFLPFVILPFDRSTLWFSTFCSSAQSLNASKFTYITSY